VCVRACVRVCVHVYVCVCVWGGGIIYYTYYILYIDAYMYEGNGRQPRGEATVGLRERYAQQQTAPVWPAQALRLALH
jgi:hypothetical protein